MFEAFGRPIRIVTMGTPRRVHRVMGQTKTYPCPLEAPPPSLPLPSARPGSNQTTSPGTGLQPIIDYDAPPQRKAAAAFDVSVDPTLNCQRDARGNAVCSNGVYYPPGCPHTPPDQYFSPGIAPDEIHNGILEARVPAPRAAGTTGGSGTSVAAGGNSLVAPVAVGGLIGAGLLYLFMK